MKLYQAGFVAGALMMLASVAPPALAQQPCGTSIVVGFGDSLSDIASRCGTTVDAILAANPRLPNRYFILPGLRLQLPPPALPSNPNVVRYTVRPGDTLLTIARAYGVTLPDIYRLNPDVDAAALRPGDMIRIPVAAAPSPQPQPLPQGWRYTVRPGDTLSSIARATNIRLSDLLRANPGAEMRPLRVGDVLNIPGAAPPSAPAPVNTTAYVVRAGDTLYSIARANGMTISQLLELNPSLDATRLRAGDTIRIRSGVVPPAPPPVAGVTATISPSSGAPGTIVSVSATGFAPSATLKLMAGSRLSTLQEFQQVTTDRRGSVTTQVRIPAWAAGPGTLVFAFETADGRLRAVSDTFRVTSAPAPAPSGLQVIGTLTREGAECPAMRGDDGKLYTLSRRDLGSLRPGDRVRVEGRVAEVSTCQQGITIDVSRIEAVR